MSQIEYHTKIRQSRFPISLFFIFFFILLLMSGIHTGLIVWINLHHFSDVIKTVIPLFYWAGVAAGLTIYTGMRIKKTYEIPMKQLAKATSQVAHGDFSVYLPPLHTPDQLDYLDVMFMDFNKMVEALGSLETLKTDFFSNVSHEFKTPLAAIQNHAELLQKGTADPETQKKYVEAILQATHRLSNLIGNMLKLNKLEKQTISPTPETYNLASQLADCALQFEKVWEKNQINFEVDIEDSVMIQADPGLLELVWTNLLSNAFKFTPPKGTISLSQKQQDDHIVVTIQDSGIGMDSATRQHIFDKFYQGDPSHSVEGNGLGLALVKRILELTNATIVVHSQLHQGSTFIVTLPVFKGEAVYES